MKLKDIKKAVLDALRITNTKELKKTRPDLVKGLDLRTKIAWQKIEAVITESANLLFQQALEEAITANEVSNQRIEKNLNEWATFKANVLAESEAEISGKLAHLADYRSEQKAKKTYSKKPTKSNIIQLKS